MKLKQISVSIENSRSRVYEILSALSESRINIKAFNIVDNGDDGQLRLIVSDLAATRRVLMKLRVPARIDEVVAVVNPDIPKGLALLMQYLKDAHIKIAYSYAFNSTANGQAVMIFHFSDNDRAIEVLKQNGIQLLSGKTFARLSEAA